VAHTALILVDKTFIMAVLLSLKAVRTVGRGGGGDCLGSGAVRACVRACGGGSIFSVK
jgi:hypothetical protein